MKDTITITKDDLHEAIFNSASDLADDCVETTKNTVGAATIILTASILEIKVIAKLFKEDEE